MVGFAGGRGLVDLWYVEHPRPGRCTEMRTIMTFLAWHRCFMSMNMVCSRTIKVWTLYYDSAGPTNVRPKSDGEPGVS